MSKFWGYMISLVGLSLLLKLGGFGTGFDSILSFIGLLPDGAVLSNSQFLAAISTLFLASAGSAILIGFFTRNAFEYVILSTFAFFNLLIFIGPFLTILNIANGFGSPWSYIILVIFGVYGFGYIMSLLEWVFNRG